jgi:TPR repeat protein
MEASASFFNDSRGVGIMKKALFYAVFVTFTLICFGGWAIAGLEDAKEWYSQGNYYGAFQEFRIYADKHDPEALYYVATMYLDGRVPRKGDRDGFMMMREAAKYGFVDAQMKLGELYEKNRGVEKDSRNIFYALKWYAIADKNGNTEGKTAMKRMMRNADERKKLGVKQILDGFVLSPAKDTLTGAAREKWFEKYHSFFNNLKTSDDCLYFQIAYSEYDPEYLTGKAAVKMVELNKKK